MLALALLLTLADPPAPAPKPGADAALTALAACPKVSIVNGVAGSGVVIAVRDEKGEKDKLEPFAYLLTASHVARYDKVEVRFPSPDGNPDKAWFPEWSMVVARWPDPDVALVRFPLGDRKDVPKIKLAGPGERPKPDALPVDVRAIGVGKGEVAGARPVRIVAKRFVKHPGATAGAFFWETEQPSALGESGGPLLNEKGEVIGICVANSDGRGYFAHLDEILAGLNRNGHEWLWKSKQDEPGAPSGRDER